MFANYKSSSEEESEGEVERETVERQNDAHGIQTEGVEKEGEADILAQFYDEIEQVEFSFKSQSDQQNFESVQENFVREEEQSDRLEQQSTNVENSESVEIADYKPDQNREINSNQEPAIQSGDEDINDNEPQTTTQQISKILRSKTLLQQRTFDYNLPCSSELQSKIEKWTELKKEGLSFNNRLENTHAFRNPSIMSKMISFLDLDPYASCLRKEIYDPNQLRQYPDSKKLVERKPGKTSNTNRLSFGTSQREDKPSKKTKKRPSNTEHRHSIGPKRRI